MEYIDLRDNRFSSVFHNGSLVEMCIQSLHFENSVLLWQQIERSRYLEVRKSIGKSSSWNFILLSCLLVKSEAISGLTIHSLCREACHTDRRCQFLFKTVFAVNSNKHLGKLPVKVHALSFKGHHCNQCQYILTELGQHHGSWCPDSLHRW